MWMFEGNVMVYSNCHLLIIISNMFLVNETLLSYCSALPPSLGVPKQFEG
jgi:hypothetical protein